MAAAGRRHNVGSCHALPYPSPIPASPTTGQPPATCCSGWRRAPGRSLAAGIGAGRRLDGQPGADAGRHRPGHRRGITARDPDGLLALGRRPVRARAGPGGRRHRCGTGARCSTGWPRPTGPCRSPSTRPTGSARRCPSGWPPARWSASAPPTSATSATRSTSPPAAPARWSAIVTVAVILLTTSVPLGLVVVLGVPVLMAVVGAADPAAAPPAAGVPRPAGRR